MKLVFEQIYNLLLEKNLKSVKALQDTDKNRKKRAKRVRFLSWLKITPSTVRKGEILPKSWKKYAYRCSSQERVEDRDHEGYLILDSHDSIRDCYCSCADFQFRWRYAMVRGDMARWQTPNQYTDIETHGPHTREPSDITNPEYQKKFCKHLTAALNKIERKT